MSIGNRCLSRAQISRISNIFNYLEARRGRKNPNLCQNSPVFHRIPRISSDSSSRQKRLLIPQNVPFEVHNARLPPLACGAEMG
jgi:hypothetical protein